MCARRSWVVASRFALHRPVLVEATRGADLPRRFSSFFFAIKIFCTKNVIRGSKRAYATLLARGARIVTNEWNFWYKPTGSRVNVVKNDCLPAKRRTKKNSSVKLKQISLVNKFQQKKKGNCVLNGSFFTFSAWISMDTESLQSTSAFRSAGRANLAAAFRQIKVNELPLRSGLEPETAD